MNNADIASYFFKRFRAILIGQEHIKRIRLRPEIASHFSNDYFRIYLEVEHDLTLSMKPIHELSDLEKREHQLYQLLNPYLRQNGEAFVAGELKAHDYWMALRDNMEKFELIGKLLEEMVESVSEGASIELEVVPCRSLPECQLAELYFGKSFEQEEFSKRSFNQKTKRQLEDELTWRTRLADLKVDKWQDASDHRMMISEEVFGDILGGESDAVLAFVSEHRVHFRYVLNQRQFHLREIREVLLQHRSTYPAALMLVEKKWNHVQEEHQAKESRKRQELEEIPHEVGDIIVVPKTVSFGRILNDTLVVARIESFGGTWGKTDINYRMVTSNLKPGSRISSTEPQFIRWSCSEEEFSSLLKEKKFKNRSSFMTWVLAQIKKGHTSLSQVSND